jgi:hypothetical protein
MIFNMYITENDIPNIWQNVVYAPKQITQQILDLTVDTIHLFEKQGQLDFGGSEYQNAVGKMKESKLEDDPKYGFWTLEAGNYLVTYNETMVNFDYIAFIFPHPRLMKAGSFHPSFIWQPTEGIDRITTILQTGKVGIKLKENARISRAITLKP